MSLLRASVQGEVCDNRQRVGSCTLSVGKGEGVGGGLGQVAPTRNARALVLD